MQHKIKILYISSYLDVGGLEILLLNFLKKLDRHKYEPIICAFCENGTLTLEFEKLNIPIYLIKKKEGQDYLLPFRLRTLIKKEKIDIIHTHNSTPWLYAGIAKLFLPRALLIHTKHSNLELNKKVLLKAERFLSYISDYVIAVAGDVAEFMIKIQKISKDKVRLIYNGIDVERFEYSAIVDQEDSKKDKIIGIVARLVAIKDHQTLLEAFKILQSTLKNVKLQIIGSGPMEEELKKSCVNLGINERVEFLGERRDIPELMQVFSVFVLSSLSEGLSITLLEAMAAGLPIVATDAGGNPDAIEHNTTGILVPKQNPKALAGAIEQILTNEKFAKSMGVKGRERVERHFGLKKMVKEYEALYQKMICTKYE